MKWRHWQRGLLACAGAWMLSSPFLIPLYGMAAPIAIWASHAAGAVLLVISLVSLVRPMPWFDWAGLVLAAWMIVAPLILGFAPVADKATSNHLLVGMFVGLMALALIAMRREAIPSDSAEDG